MEQARQTVVRPPAQLVGERAERRVAVGLAVGLGGIGRAALPRTSGRGPVAAIPPTLPGPAGEGGGPVNAVELHHGARTDIGVVREVNEDAYLAAPPVFVVADGMGGHEGGDVASAIVIEEFGRLAETGYDPRAGADVVATVLRTCQERIAEYAVTQRAQGSRRSTPAPRPWSRCWSRRGAERRPAVAARQRRRLPHLPLRRRGSRAGQRRPQRRPGARRRRGDQRGRGRGAPGAQRDHPGARPPGPSRPTTSCCRCRRPAAAALHRRDQRPDGDDGAIASARRGRGRTGRGRPPGGRPSGRVARTTRPRSSST